MSYPGYILALLLTFCGATRALAEAPPELVGRVFHLGENAEEVVEKGISVSMEPSGASTTTNDTGVFRLPIPSFLQADDLVTLNIGKVGWRIRYPLDGEVRVPAKPLRHVESIEVLPSGSKLFWTHDRIEKFIQDTIRISPQQLDKGRQEPKVDFSRAIHSWAQRYGLSAVEAKAEIDLWVEEVKKASSIDERKLGLAAFAEQQFEKAAGHFGLAAETSIGELKQLDKDEAALAERKRQARRATRFNYWNQAFANWNAMHFEEAAIAYQYALDHTSREEDCNNWADLKNSLGLTLLELGVRSSGEKAIGFLGNAIAAFDNALEVYACSPFPKKWAGALHNRGSALAQLGLRLRGEASVQLLERARLAFRAALGERTRERWPDDWARSQSNLGAVLKELAIRLGGDSANQLLSEALVACRNALEVRNREEQPCPWSVTREIEGLTLEALGRSSEAADAFLEILQVCPGGPNEIRRLLARFSVESDAPKPKLALELAKGWLEGHPADIWVRFRLPGLFFANGQFVECGEASELLSQQVARHDPFWSVQTGYSVAALLAQNHTESSLPKLDLLISTVVEQPANFRIPWILECAFDCVHNEPDLPQREALAALFEALEAADRDTILAGLQRVKSLVLVSGAAKSPD